MGWRRSAQHAPREVRETFELFSLGPPERPLFGCSDLQILQWLNDPATCPATYAELVTEFRLRRDQYATSPQDPGERPQPPRAARSPRNRRTRPISNSPSQNVLGEN